MPVVRRVAVRICVWMEGSMTGDDNGLGLPGREWGGCERPRSRGRESCIDFVSTIRLEQIWNCYRGRGKNQQPWQRQNTGVLRSLRNDDHFSYLYSICKAALKKAYAVVEELFHATHKSDMEAGAIPQQLCSNVAAFSSPIGLPAKICITKVWLCAQHGFSSFFQLLV
jgi:hypothetical protein